MSGTDTNGLWRMKRSIPIGSLLVVCGICVLYGILYYGDVYSFGFMGPEAGSERVAVQLWSMMSIGLGMLLLVTCMCWMLVPKTVIEAGIVFFLIWIALLQIPPLGLWAMVGALGVGLYWLVGLLSHLVLLAVVVRIVVRNRRSTSSTGREE